MGVAAVGGMIASCHRPTCHTMTDMPDAGWLVLRPLVWTAFTEELTFCSPRCAVLWLEAKHKPPTGFEY